MNLNFGNKLLALLLLPFIAVFILSLVFLNNFDFSKYGLSAKINDAQQWVVGLNPFYNNSKLDYEKFEDIPLFDCQTDEDYFKELKKPIKIVWTGKTRSIMQSGNYYAFEKIPEDPKYPLFGGKFEDGHFENLDGTYEISGRAVGIECGDYESIYGSTAHAEVEIDKIEKR
jgi:hypothetical protein